MDSSRIIREHLAFRVLMQAMSHPGRVYPLPDFSQDWPAVVGFLGSFIDNEVGFAVIGDLELEKSIGRYTGSRRVSPEDADYLIISNGYGSENLTHLKRGSLEYPDTGATILYLVEEVREGDGDIVVSGPGVAGKASLLIKGLPIGEVHRLRQVNGEFPLGVDAVFLDKNQRIACIPRSSRIGVN